MVTRWLKSLFGIFGMFVPIIFILLISMLCIRAIVFAGELPVEPILRIETGMHTALISKIGIDTDNRYLVTGSDDKTVRVWELSTGRLIKTLRPPSGKGGGGEGQIYAVAISPDGRTIACGGLTGALDREGHIYLFDLESGNLIKRITGLPNFINHLTYSKDGRFLVATLMVHGGIRIYSTLDYTLIAEDKDYGDNSFGAFDNQGRLITTSFDGFIRLYDSKFNLISKKKGKGGKEPFSASFSPDGSKIVVGFIDSTRVDVLSGKDLSFIFSPDTSGVNNGNLGNVTWSSDGRFLYAGGEYEKSGWLIRKWSNEGKGGYKDILAADGTIMHILPLNGGVIYGAGGPAFGIINERDERIIFKSPSIADFRKLLENFLISHDGSTVQFGYEYGGKSFARLSVLGRLLTHEPSAMSHELTPPITFARGLNITDWKNSSTPKLNGTPLKLEQGGFSRSLAISPDGNTFLLGAEMSLRLFDRNGKEKWNFLTPVVWGVNISGNGKVAVAAFEDGTIRWYRLTDGKELLAFFPHRDKKRWVMWTPKGYFDSSEGADELIGWHINQGKDKEALFYPASRFFEQFYRPEVIAEVIKSSDTDEVVLARIGEKERVNIKAGIKLPPNISILSPRNGEHFDKEDIEIKVLAEDKGGGIDEIRLYHNGKVVSEDMRGVNVVPKGNTEEKIFIVQLLEGENRFNATAFSRDRIESNPVEIRILLNGVGKVSDLYLIIVGINKYKNPALNLNYAEPDAVGIKSFFESPLIKKLFNNVNIYILMNDEATAKNIKNLFYEVKTKAKIQDTVIMYMAGHGDSVGSEWFFIPHEVVTPEVEEDLKSGGLSTKVITDTVKEFKSQKIFVMIDSCKSGGVVMAMRGFEDRKTLIQLARSTGTYVISASTDKQFAAEVNEIGHGVFTYALLEGLKGKAGDKKVTVEGLMKYVKERLPELTEKYRGLPQYPISWGTGMDFPIVLY